MMQIGSTQGDTEAPVIDFDLNDNLTDINFMALMCWPDKAVRKLRLAKIGIYMRGINERTYLAFVKRALAISAGGEPPTGTLDKLIAEITLEPAERGWLSNWAKKKQRQLSSFGSPTSLTHDKQTGRFSVAGSTS